MNALRFFKIYFREIVSGLFIFLFIYASLSKMLDYEEFRIQLGKSPLLTTFAESVAWVIPLLEISIAALLAFSKTRLIGLYASFSMMVMFTAYIIAITKFSEYIPCSCGGILQDMDWNQHLLFNLFFVFLAVCSVLFGTKYMSKG